jgi:hypothetical protein
MGKSEPPFGSLHARRPTGRFYLVAAPAWNTFLDTEKFPLCGLPLQLND